MKVIAVCGITKSGKTTTVEKIVGELRNRGYSVGSVKEIHFEKFAIDTEGSNTYRHKMAGSQLVTARGMYETDILYQRMIPLEEILDHYHHDYVILEGVFDCPLPKIITAHNTAEIDERLNDTVFAIAGQIVNQLSGKYRDIPLYSALTDVSALVDLVEQVAYDWQPVPWGELYLNDEKMPLSFAASRELGKLLAGQKGQLTYQIKRD
ncbi:MAG: molybdopterin-guanine dinucleotide biosynthesis protein B [Bacillota bacterium]|jgi:molybdopterin-guanine dinucleotide biosynthesis protein B